MTAGFPLAVIFRDFVSNDRDTNMVSLPGNLVVANLLMTSVTVETILRLYQCYLLEHTLGERNRQNCLSSYWRPGVSLCNNRDRHGPYYTANRLRVSKLTQLTIFHRSSPRVYRHGDSSRRCTVATVQDEANPSSSQPAASCCVASESTEAHRDGWGEYVLAEDSVLPWKQPKRKRGV